MKLHYRRLGSGQPMIILHGLFGMSDNWMSLGRKFAAHYNVYLLDLRNHGQSPHDPHFDYEALSDDLLEFINEHELANTILLGHSMGGKTAMRFALNHENLINKLIVVDIAAKAYDTSRFKTILQTMKSVPIENISTRKEIDNYLSKTINNKGLRQFLLKNITRDDINNFIWKLNIEALLKNIDNISQKIESDKAFIKPALLITGEKSDYVKDDDIIELKRLFPALQNITIPNATHWLHAEAPNDFYRAVISFLDTER